MPKRHPNPFMRGYRLHVRSLRPIQQKVESVVLALNHMNVLSFRGRVLSNEAVVNAVMLDFLDLSPEQQEALLRNRLRQLEAMYAQEALREVDVPAEPLPTHLGAESAAPVKPRKNRPKSK